MIEYINKGDTVTLHVNGNMAQICADVTYLIHRLWAVLGDSGEEFKQMFTACINDPTSPVFRKGDATDEPMDMEGTPWQREMALYEGAVESSARWIRLIRPSKKWPS